MNLLRFSKTFEIVCTCGVCFLAHAEPKEEQTSCPDLPQPLGGDTFDALKKNSPFTRSIDWSKALELTGIAYLNGQPVIMVVNTETEKRHLIDTTPNEMGSRLAAVNPDSLLEQAEVELIVGDETIALGYREDQTAPGKTITLPQGIPTREEYIGHDAKGPFVRVWPYLSDADRAKYKSRGVSPQLRAKFTSAVHDQRVRLLSASHQERAAATQKAFDAIIGK
jgi:hypothetical protein